MKRMNPLLVACLGDSITKGRFSYDWIGQLSNEMKAQNVNFLNFGTDGHLAYNGLEKAEALIEAEPDYIIILFGTNDVYAAHTEANTNRYARGLKLPQKPTLEWFAENLEQLIVIFKKETTAKVALVSLPLLGENLHDGANSSIRRYNSEIFRLSQKHAIGFLDLHQKMSEYLNANRPQPGTGLSEGLTLFVKTVLRKYVLLQSWDTIAAANGFVLTPDGIHLNSVSGKMLAELVKAYICQ